MAITKAENQVTWAAANSVSVTAGGNQTSDVVTLDVTCFNAAVTLKADNSTTPVAADKIYVWALQTSGDPDGASADEYSTIKHGKLLAILDTFLEDPAIETVPLPVANKSLKLYAEGATSGTTNSITVSATITEQRG